MDTATGSGLMEEFELMKQSKYRVYMQNIDKALKNFEYSSEWADLISALGKLNKVRLEQRTLSLCDLFDDVCFHRQKLSEISYLLTSVFIFVLNSPRSS